VKAYLDNLATTPLDPRVLEALLPWLSRPANPHARAHPWGWEAGEAVDAARARVAAAVRARPAEVLFTPSATAANNLAILGIAEARAKKGRHILSTVLEHPSVLEPLRVLAGRGFEVDLVPAGPGGVVDAAEVASRVRPDTVLVSVMAVNNEVGTVQPVEAVRALLGDRGPLLHVDASQAPGKVPLGPLAAAADLVTLSGHKAYGPKGGAALVVRSGRSVRPRPIVFGGGQESGLWPGTVNVAAVVGLGEALALAEADLAADLARVSVLSAALADGIRELLPAAVRNGDPARAVPHCLSLTLPVLAGETVLSWLARSGVAASLGSACATEAAKPSHVLQALGVSPDDLRRTLRFGLGRFTTRDEVDAALESLRELVARMRAGGVAL
jgi:cysteine desulfurase